MKHFYSKAWRLCLFMLLFPFLLNAQSLQSVSSFGSNPGNLQMYLYQPSGISSNAPIVVALHGCTQDASGFSNESGWNDLADRYKFYVIYPQQKSANNSSKCFNWFENGDINRGQGETLSIRNMVNYVKNNYSTDAGRVFVTGFSAGGAMTPVMLAAYPDVFSGGAIMAGIPYKAATTMTSAFTAMSPGIDKSASQWGSLVRNAYSSYSGPYPTVSIFHGTSDYTVSNNNLRELMEQWTNVHGADATADVTNSGFDGNSSITRKVYNNSSGNAVVTTFDINGMGHAVAVDPGSGEKQGGATGGYATDVNFCAAYWAANIWGLTGSTPPSGGGGINAPSSLMASAASSSSVSLTWTDNSTNETAFLVERSASSGSGYSQVASLSANTTSYTNNNLQASTTYYYRVRAQGSGAYSSYSNVASATTSGSGGGGGGGETIVIEQPVGSGYLSYQTTTNSAQSFTLNQAASLNTIAVKFRVGISNSTLKIFKGNTVSGTPIYTQNGISKGSGWQTVTVSNPPLLAAGQYTFQITKSVFAYSYTDTYSGGNIYLDTYGYTVFDAAFKLTLTASSSSSSRLAKQEENAAQNSMVYVSNFGYNPGNLGMYLYRPSNMPANAPVVVAMHGCSQTASGYAANTGWNEMADKYKFYVIYPQQSSYNNSAKCFNWFNYYDYTRGYGENRSVKSMVDYVKSNYSVNSSRVFATGFSAGGGMTTLMLATYPEVFKSGAVLAGVPYHAAANAYAAGYAMNPGYNLSPSGWGDLVRGASNYSGTWPTVAVFHGSSDYTVNDNNMDEIVDQWTNVHGTDRYADYTNYSYYGNSRVTQRKYRNRSGQNVVVTYSISSMGHDVPVDPGSGTQQGGSTGTFAADVNFHSTYWAATFFGLTGNGYREDLPEAAPEPFTWKPVSGGVELIYGSEQKQVEVRVYNTGGQVIYQATHSSVSRIPVIPAHSSSGIYIIQSISDGEVQTVKTALD